MNHVIAAETKNHASKPNQKSLKTFWICKDNSAWFMNGLKVIF